MWKSRVVQPDQSRSAQPPQAAAPAERPDIRRDRSRPVDGFVAAVRRHRLLTFFVLAYLLAWGAVPWESFFPPGALIAAVVVVAVTEGRTGLRDLGARFVRWRVGSIWWVAALGVPLLVHLVAAGGNVALGAAAPLTDQLVPWSGIPMAIALTVVNPTSGPFGEEPSFRGYALPALQGRHSPLVAAAILAVAVTGWHAPLFLMPSFGLHPIHVLSTIAVTFWYTWLFDHAGGSSLITLVAHATEGSVNTEGLFAASADASRMDYMYAAAWVSLAVVLLVADRRFWTGRAPAAAIHRPEPRPLPHHEPAADR